MSTITASQKSRLGTLRSILRKRIPEFDGIYYDALKTRYNVLSGTDLTTEQAQEFLKDMQKRVDSTAPRVLPRGHGTSVRAKLKYDDLNERPPYLASPKQLWLIDFLWSQVSKAPIEERGIALNNFLKSRFGTEHIEWLLKADVSKVITTLKAMQKQAAKRAAQPLTTGENNAQRKAV